MSGINVLRPDELITQRKITSDIKNDTDSLTFADDKALNARLRAYQLNREHFERKALTKELQDMEL